MNNTPGLPGGESASPQDEAWTNDTNLILLVDDDADILQIAAGVLRYHGYQTESAADGAAAWEALQAHRYDLLITDNNMPRVSGVELVRKVRAAHLALPVILMSGQMLPPEELNRHPWLQQTATLSKPFTADELLGTVRRVLSATDSVLQPMEPRPSW